MEEEKKSAEERILELEQKVSAMADRIDQFLRGKCACGQLDLERPEKYDVVSKKADGSIGKVTHSRIGCG